MCYISISTHLLATISHILIQCSVIILNSSPLALSNLVPGFTIKAHFEVTFAII